MRQFGEHKQHDMLPCTSICIMYSLSTHCCCSFVANCLYYNNIKSHNYNQGPIVLETRYKHNEEVVISTSVSFPCMLRDLTQWLYSHAGAQKRYQRVCACSDVQTQKTQSHHFSSHPSAHKVTTSSSLTLTSCSVALEQISTQHFPCKLSKTATGI